MELRLVTDHELLKIFSQVVCFGTIPYLTDVLGAVLIMVAVLFMSLEHAVLSRTKISFL